MNRLVVENTYCTISGKQLLNGATIHAEQGKITGLLGRNGSGKTTLFKIIFGLQRAEDCDLFYNSAKIKAGRLPAGLINFLPQKPFLLKSIPIDRILKLFKVAEEVLYELFPEFAIKHKHTTAMLSGGEERLLSAALLLLAPTKFTMLDEPFTHIMPLHLERLKQLIIEAKKTKGIIVTDHLYQHIIDMADEVFFMKDGQSFRLRNNDELILHTYISKETANNIAGN